MSGRAAGIWLGFGLLALGAGPLLSDEPAGQVLPPPRALDEPRKLKIELEALAAEREVARKNPVELPTATSERTKLRNEILSLIKKIEERKPAAVTAPPPMPAARPIPAAPTAIPAPMPLPERPKFLSEDLTHSIDPLRQAQNLYRAGYHESALKAFYLIDLESLPREDRAFVYYMSACYLRSQGKQSEAAVRFREIADLKEDSLLTESSITQLEIMKKSKEIEALSEQLRARQKPK